jgi:hypothetical protein
VTQAKTGFAAQFRAAHRPDVVQMPEPLPTIRWTAGRWVLLAVMLAAASYFLLSVTYPSFWYITRAWGLHSQRASQIPQWLIVEASVEKHLYKIALALVVLGCLWAIAGKQATGLFRPATTHVLGLAFYIRNGYAYFLLAIGIYQVALMSTLPTQATQNPPLPPTSDASETVSALTYSLAAGICEEIIATVLVYWLLERVRGSKGRSLAMTGWGTTIIIAVHLMYHTYYGTLVLVVIPSVYFSVICWRYTRSLWAIMVGHALWDILMSVSPSEAIRKAATMAIMLTAFLVYYLLKASTQAKLTSLA